MRLTEMWKPVFKQGKWTPQTIDVFETKDECLKFIKDKLEVKQNG